jgi:hypothetical protein
VPVLDAQQHFVVRQTPGVCDPASLVRTLAMRSPAVSRPSARSR